MPKPLRGHRKLKLPVQRFHCHVAHVLCKTPACRLISIPKLSPLSAALPHQSFFLKQCLVKALHEAKIVQLEKIRQDNILSWGWECSRRNGERDQKRHGAMWEMSTAMRRWSRFHGYQTCSSLPIRKLNFSVAFSFALSVSSFLVVISIVAIFMLFSWCSGTFAKCFFFVFMDRECLFWIFGALNIRQEWCRKLVARIIFRFPSFIVIEVSF